MSGLGTENKTICKLLKAIKIHLVANEDNQILKNFCLFNVSEAQWESSRSSFQDSAGLEQVFPERVCHLHL